MVAARQRSTDDYTNLTRTELGVRLPNGIIIRFASLAPDATWQLVNRFDVIQDEMTVLKRILEQSSYLDWAEKQTLAELPGIPTPQHQLLRYSGALIEHLYLDADIVTTDQAERAARLCHLFIEYWQQHAAEVASNKALPALWHSYREALKILVNGRDVLLHTIEHIADQEEHNLRYKVLRRQQGNVWLEGWDGILDTEYQRAQQEVVKRTAFRSVVLKIASLDQAEQTYSLELRVDGWESIATYTLPQAPPDLGMPAEDLHRYGHLLGEWLFAEHGLGPAYRQVIRQILQGGEYARVLLRIETTDVQSLHWERMYHPWGGGWHPLGMTEATPFARIVGIQPPSPPSEIPAGDLRILVIISSPSNLCKEYDLAEITPNERGLYHELFDHLPNVKIEYLESQTATPPTLLQLRRALAAHYDIVHFVCHGKIDSDYGLFLEDDDGEVNRVSADQILNELMVVATPALCFLTACQSAEHTSYAAFIPLGEALVKQGAASRAIAMNGPIGIETARHFITAFYHQFAIHRVVDLAMNEARRVLRDTWDWGVPVLFNR